MLELLWSILVWFLLIPTAILAIFARLLRSKLKVPLTVGFFHPYCNAAGGGEFVLWNAILAIKEKFPRYHCVVYTGDNATAAEILEKAEREFGIHFTEETRPTFVHLKLRWLAGLQYPFFTMLLQSVGSVILGMEAFFKFLPELYIDSMGFAFTFPIFYYLGGCKVRRYHALHNGNSSGCLLCSLSYD